MNTVALETLAPAVSTAALNATTTLALSGADYWLPIFFMLVMGLAMLIYVILDGYDLGIGTILAHPTYMKRHGDAMIATIAPFWDANETWLVLGVGILLTCFPQAHGIILGELYLPVTVMLIGLILRGAAFDFRTKAHVKSRVFWNCAFAYGSISAALAQGWMLGSYIMSFNSAQPYYLLFCSLIAVCVLATYTLLGACWLIIKTQGEVQLLAVELAKKTLGITALGIGLISIATPIMNNSIFTKWFSLPNVVLLAPIPIFTLVLLYMAWRSLQRLPQRLKVNNYYGENMPFVFIVGTLMLAFYGLAYSLFPYVILGKLDIWQAASATEALYVLFFGAIVVVPLILAYTIFSYVIFRGKLTKLSY